MSQELAPREIESRILSLPGRPLFMLASDLARAYQCDIAQIGQAARRNPDLFPEPEACFRLTEDERSVLLQAGHMPSKAIDRRIRAFTRVGANMAAAFIRTKVAKLRLLDIMRAFSALEEKLANEVSRQGGAARFLEICQRRGIPTDDPIILMNAAFSEAEYRDAKKLPRNVFARLGGHRNRLNRLEARIEALERQPATPHSLDGVAGAPAGDGVLQAKYTTLLEEHVASMRQYVAALSQPNAAPVRINRPFTAEEIAEILRMRLAGKRPSEIARAVGRNSSSVITLLKRELRPKGGAS
jgi:hypothetical protein